MTQNVYAFIPIKSTYIYIQIYWAFVSKLAGANLSGSRKAEAEKGDEG